MTDTDSDTDADRTARLEERIDDLEAEVDDLQEELGEREDLTERLVGILEALTGGQYELRELLEETDAGSGIGPDDDGSRGFQ